MLKEQSLEGRTAIVTGGGTGLGLSMVKKFADLANLAAFLVSDYAGYITGDVITIDGGAWLAEGGTFNQMATMDPDQIKPVIAAMRAPRKAKDPGKNG